MSLDALRGRVPPIRDRKRQVEAELQAVESAAADREQYLRIAETLESFRERLRTGARTLDVVERQKVLRSLVKEVLVGDGEITICHSIPVPEAGGSPQPSPGANSPQHGSGSQSYLLRWRRHRSPLRGPFPLPARSVRAALAALAAVLFHRHLQPRLHQPEQATVAHAPGHAPQQFGMRNLAEVVRQIGIHHLVAPAVQQAVDAVHRVVRAASRPVGVLLLLQVRFDNRRQH